MSNVCILNMYIPRIVFSCRISYEEHNWSWSYGGCNCSL